MKPARILVIDDDAAVRDVICESLRHFGYIVDCARDGIEGIEMVRTGDQPDIVISDIIMPRKEGIETIIELRKDFKHLKLIAISGGGRTKASDFLMLARKLGADATMSKPLDMDMLEQAVRDLLG